MTTTELINPPAPPSPAASRSDAGHNASPSADEHPTFGEIAPLIGAVPVEGPPVILLAGPWLLFVALLCGPFALVALMVLTAALLVALAAALLGGPYLLVRRLRGHRAGHAASDDRVAHFVPAESPRVAA